MFGSRERERKGSSGETATHRLSIVEVIDSKFIQTEAYIGAQCIGNYQKKETKSKAITRINLEENQKGIKTSKSRKQHE